MGLDVVRTDPCGRIVRAGGGSGQQCERGLGWKGGENAQPRPLLPVVYSTHAQIRAGLRTASPSLVMRSGLLLCRMPRAVRRRFALVFFVVPRGLQPLLLLRPSTHSPLRARSKNPPPPTFNPPPPSHSRSPPPRATPWRTSSSRSRRTSPTASTT